MGLYCTEGHANFVYLPAQRRVWRKVFDDAGLHVRHYADGAARITVGSRASTRAVLAAVAKSAARPAAGQGRIASVGNVARESMLVP